jgi:5'-nucleotidase
MPKPIAILLVLAMFASCKTYHKVTASDDGRIAVNFVQINDVYEIAPLDNGRAGGMARIATLKQQYLKQNPNTFLVIAGDFLSPSVYNSLAYNKEYIRGKQMIEAMNATGMDIAIFGNHELDLKENELQQRINESSFQWIASNVFHQQNNSYVPFAKTTGAETNALPKTYIKTVTDADGTTAKIGFIALTLPFTKTPYVHYEDPLTVAKQLYNQLKDSADAVIAITHQAIEDDEQLAKTLPDLAVIIGGHEHDQRFEKVGNIYITKALANAKSAFILTLTINKKTHKVEVTPKLEKVDERIALDSATNTVVQKWLNIANESFASLGFDANKVVLSTGEPLNGKETDVRNHPTNLTRLIVAAMQKAAPQADIAIMNSGSIRVDDILQMPVTQYDIIRMLPFGGSIKEVDMKGSLLVQVLNVGIQNRNTGGFLQHNDNLIQDTTTQQWTLNNTLVDTGKIYRVALSEFLLTGGEANLGFLTPANKDIVKVYDSNSPELGDIRKAVIAYASK